MIWLLSLIPLSLVNVYPIGVITMEDNGSADEKIIAIPFTDPNYNTYKNLSDLPKHVFDEMQHFFTVYKQLEGKNTAVHTVQGRDKALEIIKDSLVRYRENLFEIINKD
ncbi:MAG: inorganic diphosphatase [Clostridia bacterium]|nr:inorganic diphosphatase [Clostridia bacterium]